MISTLSHPTHNNVLSQLVLLLSTKIGCYFVHYFVYSSLLVFLLFTIVFFETSKNRPSFWDIWLLARSLNNPLEGASDFLFPIVLLLVKFFIIKLLILFFLKLFSLLVSPFELIPFRLTMVIAKDAPRFQFFSLIGLCVFLFISTCQKR